MRGMRRRRRTAGGAAGSSRGPRSSACVLIVSVRREAMCGRALEAGERGPVANEGLHAARFGGGERHLRVGQLDDVSDPGFVTALCERAVLTRLLQSLLGHADSLVGLVKAELRLPLP